MYRFEEQGYVHRRALEGCRDKFYTSAHHLCWDTFFL